MVIRKTRTLKMFKSKGPFSACLFSRDSFPYFTKATTYFPISEIDQVLHEGITKLVRKGPICFISVLALKRQKVAHKTMGEDYFVFAHTECFLVSNNPVKFYCPPLICGLEGDCLVFLVPVYHPLYKRQQAPH